MLCRKIEIIGRKMKIEFSILKFEFCFAALVKVAVRNDTGESYNKTVAFLKRDDCFGVS